MLSKTIRFAKHYRSFSLAFVLAIISLILDITNKDTIAHYILGITAITMTFPLLKDMWQSVSAGEYGIDILAITAIVSAVIAREYWAAIIIVIMLTGGEAIEDYAERRAKRELTNLIDNAPRVAHKLTKSGEIIDISVQKVAVGDLLIIRPGEVVPVDCEITEGHSSFDESSITGESLPKDLSVGKNVYSGALNMEGSVTVKALRSSKESQYEQIIKLVENASESKAPFVRLADKYSIPFTVFAYVIAFSAWFAWGSFDRFVGVLVVATPCPLLLGAPIGLISGMSRAAKNGIIIKTGTALERLANVKSIAFDKTGTLTTGELTVTDVIVFGSHKVDELLIAAASLEQRSGHTMAATIVGYALGKNLKLSNVKHVTEKPAQGAAGIVHGKKVRVGKKSFVLAEGVSDTETKDVKTPVGTQVWVSIGHQLAGVIVLEDKIREESKRTLERISALGIKPIRMLTGDNKVAALRIASSLGLSEASVFADCLPTDKLVAIHDTPDDQKPVAMVGDGVNDAPVLASADVGIALGARGSSAASETADVVIMEDNLERVATALEIAKKTFSITRQAILIGIAMSVGLMLFFALTKTRPVIGASLQELVDISVILYALRAHGPWDKKPKIKLPYKDIK